MREVENPIGFACQTVVTVTWGCIKREKSNKTQGTSGKKKKKKKKRDRREGGASCLFFLSFKRRRNITTGTNTPLKEKTFPSWTEQKNTTFKNKR